MALDSSHIPTSKVGYEHQGASIRYKAQEGELLDWHRYVDAFEKEDVVYLEFNGIQSDVTMIDSLWRSAAGAMLLCLPTVTAKQLGLVPEMWRASAQVPESVLYVRKTDEQ
ncbi:hypothetical protein [Burkholderia vietnamiensis]|uniref:hypothetical protein n=1 Tax=Burkholderia vietnamiensis TaxID=60552 RepID=UPI001CF165F3|nr:hypothetical protein [Burkholderia vietnamiensis]MCA8451379.1 hypothetical protein [Burkholderia vietnamiensis]